MRLNKEYARRGQLDVQWQANDLPRMIMRRFWALLGEFVTVGILVVVGAVVFTGD
jgi:hypothetical protein